MRSRAAVVAGLLILVGGGGTALIFHKPPASSPSTNEQPLQHRADDGPQFLMEVRSAAPPPIPVDEPAHVAAPHERYEKELTGLPLFEGRGDSVPRLAQRYPSAAEAVLAPIPPQTRHRVIDGDTLPGLAQHYLGDAARATEIFEANREVLSTPDLLPIGAMLRIPEREIP